MSSPRSKSMQVRTQSGSFCNRKSVGSVTPVHRFVDERFLATSRIWLKVSNVTWKSDIVEDIFGSDTRK
jgi:hypothetical protein